MYRFTRIIAAMAIAVSIMTFVPTSAAPSQVASANTSAVIDEGTANTRCLASYPAAAPSGPEPLSPCQWDMQAIEEQVGIKIRRRFGVKVEERDTTLFASQLEGEKTCEAFVSRHYCLSLYL